MASGTLSNNNGSVAVWLEIGWSSTKGTGGSTVNATLYAHNRSNVYCQANVYGGYNLTVDGTKVSGSGAALSGSHGGSVGLISKSKWVAYTNTKTISLSGYADFRGIYISNYGYLGEETISGSAQLDQVGYPPTMGKVLTPKKQTIDETTKTIEVTWEKATSYDNSCYYSVGCSINGGAYVWDNLTSSNINTTSYTYTLKNPKQGDTYQFALSAKNNVGWSSYTYSEIVTINELSMPTIGDLPSPYNPFIDGTLKVPITGGGQSTGSNFYRCASLYYNGLCLATVKPTTKGNTSISFAYTTDEYLQTLGKTKYTDTFTIMAWTQNDNGSTSQATSKDFIVNINSDGGATPTLASPVLSGGALGYSSTCFVVGVSTLNVSSPQAVTRRAPSGVTVKYKIACTGETTQDGMNVKFNGLTSGLKTITVTATDSRGLTVTATKQCRFQPYIAPTITKFNATRTDEDQSKVKLTYTMAYSEIYQYPSVDNKGSQLNTISTQQYSKDSTTWTNCVSGDIIPNMSTEMIYSLILRIADKVRPTVYITNDQKIPTQKTGMAIRKWGVGINCVPQNGNALEVNGKSYLNGDVVLDNLNATESTIELNGTISKAGNSKTYVKGREGALVYNRYCGSTGRLSTVAAMETKNGVWTLGTIGDSACLTYCTNDNYNSNTNTVGANFKFPSSGSWMDILLYAFPVGSIYLTYNDNNPGNFLGGTWEQFGQGRTLIGEGTGSDGSTSMSFTTDDIGGEYTHKLTTQEMPGHNHYSYHWAGSASKGQDSGLLYYGQVGTVTGRLTSSTGGNKSHNIIQPYIVVYFWRRTA